MNTTQLRASTIELSNDKMEFSAGHFTIFSATERENIHGHNYRIFAELTTLVSEYGINFDYRYYKKKLYQLCDELNFKFLVPTESPYLQIEPQEDYTYLHFNNEKIPFLSRDILLLPIKNATVEEISHYILERLTTDTTMLEEHKIIKVDIKVSSSPGVRGSATWQK